MCIIAIKPSSKAIFDDVTIKEMFSRNPDGAGAMWFENGKVHIQKGFMNITAVLDFVHSRNWGEIPLILHFRIGTAGPNNEMNCHPYPIGRKNALKCTCTLGMAHNGILSKYNPPFGSEINDTQNFINTILNELPKNFLENTAICKLIESESIGSRLAFLDKNGTITRFGNWIEDDGYFYSNTSYKPYAYRSFEFPLRVNTSTHTTEKKDSKSSDDDKLSFERLFKEDDGYDYFMYKDDELNDIIDELDEKCLCTDDCIYESNSGDYTYEISTDYNIVFRYSNTLF